MPLRILRGILKRCGWNLLIIAHTPKLNLSSPITQNDMVSIKKLYNFFDSVFAIGKSIRDERLNTRMTLCISRSRTMRPRAST